VGISLGEPETQNDNQREPPCGAQLASCAASAAHAQTSRPQNGEFVRLDRPAVFDINPNTGSLKESVQKGQQLVWHPKEKPNEARFQVTNMSVAFLRSESGGQVKMTFTGNISSLGYLTAEEAKLNAIVRAKGGASLHSWSFGVSVKCADKDQPLTPLTHDVPNDLAQNIFTNVSTVGIGETGRAEFPRGEGSAVQLMGKPHRADMPPRINAITGFSSWATWAVQGFGEFNGDGTTDMIMRNFNTGDLQLYDIVNNQITNSLFLARSGWIAGSRASRPSTHPALRSRVAQHQHWSIRGVRHRQRSHSLGAVGLDWHLGGLAVDPPTGSGCSR
jgi:hypothetical protein